MAAAALPPAPPNKDDPPSSKIVLKTGQVIDPDDSADLTNDSLKKVAAEACEEARKNRAAIEALKKAPDSGAFKSGAARKKDK